MIEATVLGRRVDYPSTYSPNVLVGVPRQVNREGFGLMEEAPLPFCGYDSWNAYEISCLTDKGLPVVGTLKMVVPADSPKLVESKSLKLYLNSFNMERMGSSPSKVMESMRSTVEKDISRTVGAAVQVKLFGPDDVEAAVNDDGYQVLEDLPGVSDCEFTDYTEASSVLTADVRSGRMKVKSHLLRSNCKITHQPDWGTIWIDVEGDRLPTHDSLLKYIVSLRGENHFHEEICELVFMRLMRIFAPKRLAVVCAYTRRGGIDINPCRATHHEMLPAWLIDCACPIRKQGRQ